MPSRMECSTYVVYVVDMNYERVSSIVKLKGQVKRSVLLNAIKNFIRESRSSRRHHSIQSSGFEERSSH